MTSASSKATITGRGQRVVHLEQQALARLEGRIGDAFVRAVQLIAASKGRVIVSGVGKSGLIGRKIAATLTSTGTPATFLHPADSVHGDLGIVGRDDVAILISKSGESDELLALVAHLEGFGVRSVAITGDPGSTLGRACTVSLDGGVDEEACPHDLAPTTSTTVALCWATRSPSRCSRRRAFSARISRGCTPAARSAENWSCGWMK